MKRLIKKIKNSAIKSAITLSKRFNFPERHVSSSVQSAFLIVSTTGIGDTLWGTPAIKALRKTFPHGQISVLTNPSGYEILKGNPCTDDIFIFRRGLRGCFSLPGLLAQLRRKNIDTVFIFHASDRIIWPICFFTGASEIIGIEGQNKGLDFILTQAKSPQNNIHGIEARLRLVKQVGAETPDQSISVHLSGEDRENAGRFLESNGIKENSLLIGFHPGAQEPFKCWPAKNFIDAGNVLMNRYDCRIIITGNSNEKALAEDIASGIRGAVPVAGKLSIRETAAIIEKMSLFVTNDTGPMHIAFALKTPTIAIFSPTDPVLCGPHHAERAITIKKPITCNPCIGKKCLTPACMEQVTVDEVIAEAKTLLIPYDKKRHETNGRNI